MKKKRCYRCGVETPIGKALSAFVEICREAEKKAQQWVEKYGAREYLESPVGMAGGVSMIIKPDDLTLDTEVWRAVNVPDVGLCYEPNVADDFNPDEALKRDHIKYPLSLAEEIELERLALPVASENQLVALLKPKMVVVDGKPMPLVMSETPSLFIYDSSVLSGSKNLELGSQWYVAVPFEAEAEGLTEVTQKEFYRRRMVALNVN